MHRIIPILTFVFLLLIVEAANAQQGIGTNTPDRSAAVEIKSASRGLLIPRVALMATNVSDPVDNPAESLMVYNIATTDDVTPGYYYWKRDDINSSIPGEWMRLGNDMEAENGLYIDDLKIGLGGELNKETIITQGVHNFIIATQNADLKITDLTTGGVQGRRLDVNDEGEDYPQHLLAVDDTGIVNAIKAAMPKFFYMPSVLIPTAQDQIDSRQSAHISFNDSTREGEINLYAIYAAQFGSPLESNPAVTTTLPVLPASELDYFITWYDDEVFENVSVDDDGILTYKVITPTEITMGTFMNIVFAVKP